MTVSAPGNRPVKAVRTLVYLARHDQTPLSESDVLRGLTDPPLMVNEVPGHDPAAGAEGDLVHEELDR